MIQGSKGSFVVFLMVSVRCVSDTKHYAVALISRLLEIIGLFCKTLLQKSPINETIF